MRGDARSSTVELTTAPSAEVSCDESGLCEAIDRHSAGARVSRCFDSRANSVALVDLSPIEVGHALVVPRRHVTTSLDLAPPSIDELWTFAQTVAARLESDLASGALLLEHGISRAYAGPACVRHSHIHVCPVTAPSTDVAVALHAHLNSYSFFESLDEALMVARQFDSHVLGRVSGRWFAGEPRRSIRQVTRRLLASVVDTPPDDVDWYFGAGGARYFETLAYWREDRTMGPSEGAGVVTARLDKIGRCE